MRNRNTVAIEPCANGFVIRQCGVEKVSTPTAGLSRFAPWYVVFHFPTIDAARDFCWACDFTWSVRVSP